jgi:tRNA dimethylallyltransferase
MLDAGWDQEVLRLLESGLSLESNAFQAIGYREVAEWVLGRAGRKETEDRIVTATRRLVKRQMTWFRREHDALWVSPEQAARATLARLDGPGETERDG